MGDSSADITRIQIERVEDWDVVRENFTGAMMNSLENRLAQGSSQHVREAVLAHLMQVSLNIVLLCNILT